MVLAVGLVLELVALGVAGYTIDTNRTHRSAPPVVATRTSVASPPIDTTDQYMTNQRKLGGALASLARPWLTRVQGCVANNDPGGPRVEAGEVRAVACRYRGLSVNFVLFQSATDRAAALAARKQQNRRSAALAPGVAPATTRPLPAGPVDYVEYASQTTQAGVVVGIWWSSASTLACAYLQTPWAQIGRTWLPLRDVWQQYA